MTPIDSATLYDKLQQNDASYEALFLNNSGLPGPRMNLELVNTFVAVVKQFSSLPLPLITTIFTMKQIRCDDNQPEMILAACGIQSLGVVYLKVHDPKIKALARTQMVKAMSDKRWRGREIIVESYKIIANADYADVMDHFDTFQTKGNLYEYRAILATLAHPELLKLPYQKAYASKWCALAFARLATLNADNTPPDTLDMYKEVMNFAPSVIVAADPDVGFPLLEQWLDGNDVLINPCIKENLKKKRLIKNTRTKRNDCWHSWRVDTQWSTKKADAWLEPSSSSSSASFLTNRRM